MVAAVSKRRGERTLQQPSDEAEAVETVQIGDSQLATGMTQNVSTNINTIPIIHCVPQNRSPLVKTDRDG